MRVTASIQARMGSTRLPGKVLKKICGKPMLLWQIERIRGCKLVDNIVVATSISKSDNIIEKFCNEHGIECYRGPEDDVLKRVASLVTDLNVELHLEFFGDSPLVDPNIIEKFISYFIENQRKADYFSNAIKTTYPPGLEVSLYFGSILVEVDKIVNVDDPLREHCGYNITRFPEKFKLFSLEAPDHHYNPNLYLEVDTIEDLQLMQVIFSHFERKNIDNFNLEDILEFFLQQPELMKINNQVDRRWKLLRQDK